MELKKDNNQIVFIYNPISGYVEWLIKELEDNEEEVTHVAGTFYFNKDDIIKYDEDYIIFKVAELHEEYYIIRPETLGTDFSVFIHKEANIEYKMISCSKYKNLFEFINEIRKSKEDIYIGGINSTLPIEDFIKITKQFPNGYEKELYIKSRISQVLDNYFDNVDDYSKKLETYRDNKKYTKYDKLNLYTKWDIIKYENILEKIKKMMDEEEKYSESEWGKIIAEIILILFPKYINYHEQVNVKMTTKTSKKEKEIIDFMLVKSDGCIDVLEIKKVSNIFLVSNSCDHDNHYATNSLSKVTMQIEKYLYNIMRDSLNFEKQINEKYAKNYRENFKLKVVNPKGIVLMGKSIDLSEKQLLDLEIIRKMYSNIVDIYTYNDIIFMLENILDQIKKKISRKDEKIRN